jgi:hypothetical protein
MRALHCFTIGNEKECRMNEVNVSGKKILKFKKYRSITRAGGGIITKIKEPELI